MSTSLKPAWPAAADPSADDCVFSGLKVLDVGSWIAGPVATTILADYGADVIKVEVPGAGDPYRQLSQLPITPDADVNYMWLMDARNKRSLTLNLRSDEGRQLLLGLVRECDVYVTNQPLPVRRKFKLTYEDIAPQNERMIYASLTAYGEQGPDAEREGFDLVAYWARTGLMDIVRAQGAEPAQSVPGMGDHPTAVALYSAVVTALLRRQQTGLGGKVHTSLLANGLWSASCIAQAAFAQANFDNYQHPQKVPVARALYQTADNAWLSCTMVRSPDELQGFFEALGVEDLLQLEQFATPELRFDNGAQLVAHLRSRIREHSSEHWLAEFAQRNVPVALVGTISDLPQDTQLQVNRAVVAADENIGMSWVINHPVNVDGSGRRELTRAPEVGEHNQEILSGLGLTPEQIQGLQDAGII